jgi:ATP-dependent DNA ligase
VRRPVTKGWVFEEKYDGYRILAYKAGSRVTLLSRNDTDYTKTFAEVAADVARLRPRTLLLDGEAVAFDPKRLVSSFQLLRDGCSPSLSRVTARSRQGPPLATRRPVLMWDGGAR